MEFRFDNQFSKDMRYVDSFLELLSLMNNSNLNEIVDQILEKVVSPLITLDSVTQFKQDVVKCDSLKLLLLCKWRLLERKSSNHRFKIDHCKRLLRLCIFSPNMCDSVPNLEFIEIALWLLNTKDFISFVSEIIENSKNMIEKYTITGSCLFESNEINPIFVLKLIQTLIQVCTKKYSTKDEAYTEFYRLLDGQNIHDNLVELALGDNRNVSVITLTRIYPEIEDPSFRYSILTKLWMRVKELWKGNTWKQVEQCKIYFVLSSLANQFFPEEGQTRPEEISILSMDNVFWEIILFGIGRSNPTTRKQSRFLLRKALDFIFRNSVSIPKTFSAGFFEWKSDCAIDLGKVWSDYFLILEALEEKQVHLIEPVLNRYENSLLRNLDSYTSPCWNLPIFQVMFSHDSNYIVRYGLRLFTSQKLDYCSSSDVNIVSFLLYPLLHALNNTYLYMKHEKKEFDVENGIKNIFSSLLNLSENIRHEFLTRILERLCEIAWGPVPLFYIMKALSSLDVKEKIWEDKSFMNIKLFLVNTLQTHSLYIRGAIQCCIIKSLISFSNTDNVQFFYIADVIGTFCQDESLRRGSDVWNHVVNWFQQILNQEKVKNFISFSFSQLNDKAVQANFINSKALARMCVLLLDSSFFLCTKGSKERESFKLAMYPLLKYLDKVENRPYVSKTMVHYSIEFLSHMMEECHIKSEHDFTHRTITTLAAEFLRDIAAYLRRRLYDVANLDDFSSINIYLSFLRAFSNEKVTLSSLLIVSDGLVDDAFSILESRKGTVLSSYFAVKILCWMGEILIDKGCSFKANIFLKNKSKLSSYIKRFLSGGIADEKSLFLHFTENIDEFKNVHSVKGQITSEYVQSHWILLHYYLSLNREVDIAVLCVRNSNVLIEDAMESIEIGGREALSSVMAVCKFILPDVLAHSFDMAAKFCSLCWTSTFEHRKSEFFWTAIEKFIQMLFQTKIMLMLQCESLVMKFSQDIYTQSQTIARIFSIFIEHLYKETFDCGISIWKKYYNILINALVYGPVLRKDQRIYKDTCEYIQSFGTEFTVNQSFSYNNFSDTSIRVKGISLLLYIIKSDSENTYDDGIKTLSEQLTDCLWQNVMETNQGNTRYYGNSHVHRSKQRAMQSLLILEISLNKERSEKLMISLCNSLLIESHQPSVKYLQEWLLVRILIHNANLRDKMWEIFQEVGSKRTGCMSSFIAVAYHLAISLSISEQENFIMKCMENVLPWCMAQQFNVRLYAQVAVQKLWDLAQSLQFMQVNKEYSVVYKCLNSGVDQAGNVKKNLQKLKENFYFDVFNPLDHFSIETIYYDIPRLANVSSEEWISPTKFESINLYSILPLRNSNTLLRGHSAGEWIVKSVDTRTTSSAEVDQNIQKKIMPWKLNVPQPEMEFSVEDIDIVWRRKYGPFQNQERALVVVASLIDRPPNLGGLCRTCEAFGVSEYVLGSLKYAEDRQFQNLSVSAERWISISEVKPYMLASYLKSMKEKGYSLIGAEQTASSITLNEFKFPKKSLLLLGNEKDGVPADLLPLLDSCVEVPQQGLIRSLNVHVTGAIFVWEYAKQHSSSN